MQLSCLVKHNIIDIVGVVCNLVISVDVHSYFTGIAL